MFNNQNILDPDNLRRVQDEVNLNTFNPIPQHIPDQASLAREYIYARLTGVTLNSSTGGTNPVPVGAILSYKWAEVRPSRSNNIGGVHLDGTSPVVTWDTTGWTSDGGGECYVRPGDFNIRYDPAADDYNHQVRDANIVILQKVSTCTGSHYVIQSTPPTPFWARLIEHTAGSTDMGYKWKEMIPNWTSTDVDLKWVEGILSSDTAPGAPAFEANGIPVGLDLDEICAGRGGNIVLLHPTLEQFGISYVFFHSESCIKTTAKFNPSAGGDGSTPPGTGSTLDEKMWDKFKGYSTDAGATWAKRTGTTLYDSFAMYVQVREKGTTAPLVPVFRLMKWDAQGHLVHIGIEEAPAL